MKKSFFAYLIALLLLAGVSGYFVYSQNKKESGSGSLFEVNGNNLNSAGERLVYTDNEANFSLKYPSEWQIDETNSTANKKIFFAGNNGPRYDFSLAWENGLGRYNCEQINEQRCQSALSEYYNKYLGEEPDEKEVERIKATCYPVSETKETAYSFCRLPDIIKAWIKNEHYLLVNKKNVFDVFFPSADSSADSILEPDKNYSLAKEILESISFSETETEINDWQDYQNKEMGYAIKFPENWFGVIKNYEILCSVNGSSDCIEDSFSSVEPEKWSGAHSNGFDFYVMKYKFDNNKSLNEIYKYDEDIPSEETIKAGNYEFEISEPVPGIVNGQESFRYSVNAVFSTEPCYIEEVLIRSGDYVYDIEAIVLKKSNFESYRDIFEEIIRSFETI